MAESQDRGPSRNEARHLGMMLDVLRQLWAGALGAGPQPGSPLQHDLDHQDAFATSRLPAPISQAWAYAQTVGQAATDHQTILREALLRYASGNGSRPVVSILTLARSALELLAFQRWVTDPSPAIDTKERDTKERVARWYSLEASGARDQWNAKHIGRPPRPPGDDPQLQALAHDADCVGITVKRDGQGRPSGVGPGVPTTTSLATELLDRYRQLASGVLADPSNLVGEHVYRLFSGGPHGKSAHILGTLLPTGQAAPDGTPVHTYQLSPLHFWLAAAAVFMASYAAASDYAGWLGIEVPEETQRVHVHHVEVAMDKIRSLQSPR